MFDRVLQCVYPALITLEIDWRNTDEESVCT